MAINFLSPGVGVIEVEAKVRNVTAVSTSVAGLAGIAEKGPIGKPVPLTSFEEYLRIFGGPVPDSQLYWNVKGFFENSGEGTLIWIVRTAHYTTISDPSTLTALPASVDLDDISGDPTLRVSASSPGTWGNTLQVTTQLASRFSTTLAAQVADGDTNAQLVSIAGIRIGTVLHMDDGTDEAVVVVTKIENDRVFFDAVTLAAPIALGSPVVERSFNLIILNAGAVVS